MVENIVIQSNRRILVNVISEESQVVGHKAKRRISKRVSQENKAR